MPEQRWQSAETAPKDGQMIKGRLECGAEVVVAWRKPEYAPVGPMWASLVKEEKYGTYLVRAYDVPLKEWRPLA
jgi:hypothetical protein